MVLIKDLADHTVFLETFAETIFCVFHYDGLFRRDKLSRNHSDREFFLQYKLLR
jgi:hypothetical protein